MTNIINNKIIIYKGKTGQPSISVLIENETAWLNQAQLVDLFDSSKANVSEHIKNIFIERELLSEATVRKFRTVQKESNRKVTRKIAHYNLDMIISLGYRIKSKILKMSWVQSSSVKKMDNKY